MNTTNIRVAPTISNAKFTELYVPNNARIKSPSLQRTLEYAKFMVTSNCTVSFIDYAGTTQLNVAFIAGQIYPGLVQAITACSVAGALYIQHNGLLFQGSDDL